MITQMPYLQAFPVIHEAWLEYSPCNTFLHPGLFLGHSSRWAFAPSIAEASVLPGLNVVHAQCALSHYSKDSPVTHPHQDSDTTVAAF